MLEKLTAMNATKIELRQYNLPIIITVDIIRSSAGRTYFDTTMLCAHDCREGPVVIQTDNLNKFHIAWRL